MNRTSNKGDAQIGFWFYQAGTAPAVDPITGAQDFAPEHAVGDLLVLANFTGGGKFASVSLFKWVRDGTGNAPNTNGMSDTLSITAW